MRDVELEGVLPEAQQTVVELLKEMCGETGTELRTYDTCTFGGRVLASFKHVKKTPTIICGSNKIAGTAERDPILSLLK